MDLPVYLDHNATTPVDPRVLERMLPYFSEQYGNASSKAHPYGWTAEEAVNQAREELAALIGADPEEVVFTSGATESINTALKGVAGVYSRKGRHIVTVKTEHSAVLDSCRALEKQGYEVTYLPVDRNGLLASSDLENAIRDDTILVAVMWANNELGTIHPIHSFAEIARTRGVLFMTDATQAVGKIPVDAKHADLLACSAHKFYGPKGIGALYIRRRNPRVRLAPLLNGGGQERGWRGGTLNVPGIVGMGAAAVLARNELEQEGSRLQTLRNRLEEGIGSELADVTVNAQDVDRLPQTTSITFGGLKAASLMMAARDLAVSAGSACASGTGQPSHVLKAIGLADEEALATIRFSLGRYTTEEQVDYAVRQIVSAAESLMTDAPKS